MGRLFIQYCEDDTASRYTCLNCGVDVASNSAVIWSGHMGMQKPAFLLRGTTGNVVPISKPRQERLHTGLYTLQTLGCRCCAVELGWLYVSCHGHAEHLYKQGCSLLEQAALRASPSRMSLANARQELRKMQQGQPGGMQASAHRPTNRHVDGSSSSRGSSGTSVLLGDGQGLRRSGVPPTPVFTQAAEAYHRQYITGSGGSLRLQALREDAMQALREDATQVGWRNSWADWSWLFPRFHHRLSHHMGWVLQAFCEDAIQEDEGPSGRDTVGRGPEGGDASARGASPFVPFSLEDLRRQQRHSEEHLVPRGGPHTGGQRPSSTLSAAEHLARNWISGRGRTEPSNPPRPSLQHMLSVHLEALERAPPGSSPAAVAARQTALTNMNQALNALHNHEQHTQHEAHVHRDGRYVYTAPGPMSERREEGTENHDDEELPEAGGLDEEALQQEAVAAVAALEEAMDVTRLPERAVAQTTIERGAAPPRGVIGRLFPDEEPDSEVMSEDPGQEEGGVEGEGDEVDEDLGIADMEQLSRGRGEAEVAGTASFHALGEVEQSQAPLEEQLMIDAFMEGMDQDQDSDLERVMRTSSSSHNPGGPLTRMPPPPWWAGGGLVSRQAQQHRLDHHLAERQLAPSQRTPGYRMPPFLTRSLRRNGPPGSEARIAWPATAASERRREIGDGGREGIQGIEAPGAGAEPIPCLPRSIQPQSLNLSVAPPLDRQRSPL